MKNFHALFIFVQYGEIHSTTRYIQCSSWETALEIATNMLSDIMKTMKDDGVTAVQLQSLTITNP